DGGRVRPDGAQLLWQTARHATPDLPFLCGDITPRALRVPEGNVREHPNGALGVASLTVAVHDLDASLGRYKALLGPGLQETADSEGVRLALPGFDLLLQGVQAQTDSDALRQRLATRGEGPCAFTLRQRPGATAPA
ncbi:VOC family protein, partial [Burkholderia sola]